MTNWKKDYSAHIRTAQYISEQFLDVLAPPRCMVCIKEGVWLCRRCEEKLPPFRQACLVCERDSARGLTCTACRAQTDLMGLLAAGHYQSPAFRRAVQWLKFKAVRPVAEMMAELLLPHLLAIAPLPQLAQEAVLVPMPLHRLRFLERGFNQSNDIAQALSAITNIQVVQALQRQKSTFRQSQLPHELRQKNVMGAFSLVSEIPTHVSKLIIIDDVATTGATLSEAASAWRENFEGQIWAVTFARG